jgi:sugar-phosphatase
MVVKVVMIQPLAVIFDMDGVLIDSEPLWHKAEVGVFRALGVPLDETMCLETTGLRPDEVVNFWYGKYPWQKHDRASIEHDLIATVETLIRTQGVAKRGVPAALAFLRRRGYPLAVASSSPYRLITTVCEKLNLGSTFSVVHSAEDETLGKPHPAVYLTTAAKLGVPATRCVAIEDSPNGIIAALAARMKCIAIPDARQANHCRFAIADLVLDSLEEIEQRAHEILPCLTASVG